VKHHSDSTKKLSETYIFNMFCCNVSFPTDPHRRSRVAGQDMKLTYLYVWYPSFQAQWDRLDEQNHQV
jgi:hypothetical protein